MASLSALEHDEVLGADPMVAVDEALTFVRGGIAALRPSKSAPYSRRFAILEKLVD